LATVDLRVLSYFRIGDHGKLDLVVEAFSGLVVGVCSF
jgi:hypothetical protein